MTIETHRPPEHRAYRQVGIDQLLVRAERVGPTTREILERQLCRNRHPGEVIRKVMGLLHLAARALWPISRQRPLDAEIPPEEMAVAIAADVRESKRTGKPPAEDRQLDSNDPRNNLSGSAAFAQRK